MSATTLLGAPSAPVDVASEWGRYRAVLTSWDGTTWDVTDYRSGLAILPSAVVGLSTPPVTRRATTSATESGSRWRSRRVEERPVILPLYLYSNVSSEEWLERDAAFWRAMRPDRTCTLDVTVPGATSRRLVLRYVGDDEGFERDPIQRGWARYALEMVAEQPFWEGTPVVRSWQPQPSQPFFGGNSGGGLATPFYISSGQTLANAVMDNPGDEDSYAVWLVEALDVAGITSVTVGTAGRLTTAPFLIPEGQSLTIDPRPGPRGKSAYDSFGNRRTAELSVRDFAPIPPGASVPLSLAMVGNGRVTARLVPLHHRAWG